MLTGKVDSDKGTCGSTGEAPSPESVIETKIDEQDNLENIQEKMQSTDLSKISSAVAAIDVELRSDISTDSCREPPRKKVAVEKSQSAKVSDNDSGISTTNNASSLTIPSPKSPTSKKSKGTILKNQILVCSYYRRFTSNYVGLRLFW